jgi:putative membrane protein
MMKNRPWILVLFCALALTAFACHHETTDNNNTTTDTYATSTNATDTSATTSTLATSGTETSGTTGTTSSASTPVDPADSDFMTKAAQGGMAEVALGQMASSKATDPGVKAFGDRMVTDHSRLNDEMKQLAQTKGVTLPTDVDDEAKKTSDKLSKLTGKAFDKEYISDMVKDHEKDVKEFEKQSTGAKDADLKTWVTNSLPTLQDHLKMAKDTKAKLK